MGWTLSFRCRDKRGSRTNRCKAGRASGSALPHAEERWREGARRTAIACVSLALAACATIPRLAAPEIRSAQVRVIVLDVPRVRIGVDLAVFNPNAQSVALNALDVDLDVEGVPVAKTSLAQPVELRALETTQVSLDTSGHLGAALAGVARSLERGNRGLRYEIAGVARLADGSQFPFRRGGVLAYR